MHFLPPELTTTVWVAPTEPLPKLL